MTFNSTSQYSFISVSSASPHLDHIHIATRLTFLARDLDMSNPWTSIAIPHWICPSLVAQTIKCLPTMRETWVQSPGLGRSSGEGNGTPLQYSCLENPMDRGAWQATVHGVAKSWTQLSNFTFTFYPLLKLSRIPH